ncbi:MAG: transglutaminase family protein [Pseudomonadota bacterium]|jgi:transglutaminase-like putative cysteine protease|nr:transglutaminase family protein [Syntrophobacterales bacterium]MDI9556213.1 transglutaminase family protein [Pseudomonadota bacterium]NLX32634.1 transglutaminase family protein [Deltaproteobacteria bacterium]HNU85132.1 transglutaminase family protein [Syntrophales bacterium]HNZ34169.1 transglutaminase family protein [Syntrophales bacterium]
MEAQAPEDLRSFLRPTFYIDSESDAVVVFARAHASGETATGKAVSLFRAVRDEILYDPYNIRLVPDEFKASVIIGRRRGYCVAKAIVLAAAARASGIPSRIGFADVKNHLSTERLRRLMKTDVFVFHGYTELYLDGRWLKVTPTFNTGLCEKFGVRPLEFDGTSDCLFHEFDRQGKRHMQYLRDHGAFADVPFERIVAEFDRHYPGFVPGDGGPVGGDFDREAIKEASGKGMGPR